MPESGRAAVRIARPSRDLEAAERFWAGGLGLDVLFRKEPEPAPGPEAGRQAVGAPGGGYRLLMLGWRDAGWHLELAHDPRHPVAPAPTDEDLLVLYLGGPVPQDLLQRLEEHGGRRVPARNPYWDTWGVTLQDPDGYRLVLSTRDWSNARA